MLRPLHSQGGLLLQHVPAMHFWVILYNYAEHKGAFLQEQAPMYVLGVFKYEETSSSIKLLHAASSHSIVRQVYSLSEMQ